MRQYKKKKVTGMDCTLFSAKYPRTYHLPWSPGGTSDDKRMQSVDTLIGTDVVMTEKMDGTNTCLLRDAIYARSHSVQPTHVSFNWLKAAHATLKQRIPSGFSVFCEYLYAVHTIVYDALPHYIFVIAVRDDSRDMFLSWQDTMMFADELELPTVPVIGYNRFMSESELRMSTDTHGAARGFYGEREGVVVRSVHEFTTEEFPIRVGKWVRKGHVPDDAVDWWKRPVQRQRLLRP